MSDIISITHHVRVYFHRTVPVLGCLRCVISLCVFFPLRVGLVCHFLRFGHTPHLPIDYIFRVKPAPPCVVMFFCVASRSISVVLFSLFLYVFVFYPPLTKEPMRLLRGKQNRQEDNAGQRHVAAQLYAPAMWWKREGAFVQRVDNELP